MDFEPWIRAQLGRPDPAGRPVGGGRSRFRVPVLAVQLVGALVALSVVALGIAPGRTIPALRLETLAPAPALPANTWAGPPPQPPLEPASSPGAAAAAPGATPPGPTPGAAPRPTPTGGAAGHGTPRPDDHPAGPGPGVQPAASSPSTSQTFQLQGGTATLSCRGSVITIDSAIPSAGFAVERDSSDGGAQVEVRFSSDTHESRLEGWCSGGQVRSQISEEDH